MRSFCYFDKELAAVFVPVFLPCLYIYIYIYIIASPEGLLTDIEAMALDANLTQYEDFQCLIRDRIRMLYARHRYMQYVIMYEDLR